MSRAIEKWAEILLHTHTHTHTQEIIKTKAFKVFLNHPLQIQNQNNVKVMKHIKIQDNRKIKNKIKKIEIKLEYIFLKK